MLISKICICLKNLEILLEWKPQEGRTRHNSCSSRFASGHDFLACKGTKMMKIRNRKTSRERWSGSLLALFGIFLAN
jgi:hypothetical protein